MVSVARVVRGDSVTPMGQGKGRAMERPSDNGVGNRPSRNPDDWFNAAVGLFIASIVGVFIAAVIVFGGDGSAEWQRRAQAITPFGAAIFAFLTFATVVWRGLLLEEQTRQQKRQNDAKDAEQSARLVIDGAKLVAQADRFAGIVALGSVAAVKGEPFAPFAMDILVRFAEAVRGEEDTRAFEESVRAINNGAKAGNISRLRMTLSTDDSFPFWPAVNGVPEIEYRYGILDGPDYAQLHDLSRVKFRGVNFTKCVVDPAGYYAMQCKFENCRIGFLSVQMFRHCVFEDCDFTDAQWYGEHPDEPFTAEDIRHAMSLRNYFQTGHPPQLGEWADIMPFLEERPDE